MSQEARDAAGQGAQPIESKHHHDGDGKDDAMGLQVQSNAELLYALTFANT
jgi:hypothetical protein